MLESLSYIFKENGQKLTNPIVIFITQFSNKRRILCTRYCIYVRILVFDTAVKLNTSFLIEVVEWYAYVINQVFF